MKFRRCFPFFLLTIAAASSVVAAAGEPSDDNNKYVRVRRDEQKEPIALDTAIARFVPKGDGEQATSVDLVAAIHVADKAYYEQLNQRFKTYDAVLYELVAPEGTRVPPPGSRPSSVVSGVQVGMTQLLDLSFQLDGVDYKAKNLVHADMSPEEFSASMKQRNESVMGMIFRMMGRGFADQAKDPLAASDWRILSAMFAEDRPYRLKVAMAGQFADLDGQMDIFDGPEGSTLVTERNKKALNVLKKELEGGKRHLAIFYGAGHLADMQRRLEADFGMKRVTTEWLTAWSLTRPERSPASRDK